MNSREARQHLLRRLTLAGRAARAATARAPPVDLAAVLTAAESRRLTRVREAAKHAGVRAIPLGDTCLLKPWGQAPRWGVLVPLASRLTDNVATHLPAWVQHTRAWPTRTHTELARAPPNLRGPH